MYRIYLLIFIFTSLASASSYIVLSSTEASVKENIDISDLRDIFLGHRIYWRDGNRVFAAHINKDSAEMKKFLKEVLSMTPRKFNKYWRRRLFSGKGHPPLEIESDNKILDYIKKTDGSIAIIRKLPTKVEENLYFFKASSDGHSLNLIK